jgi:uncharacterized protein
MNLRKGKLINTREVTFKSGNLTLVGALNIPDQKSSFPGVVVCHPHPKYGGSMDNNVVDSICINLKAKSIISLKFNFRGVGESEGEFSNGSGEEDDVKSAIEFLLSQKELDPLRLGLAGYSAGSAWGVAAACRDPRVKSLAAISPPLSMFDYSCLRDCIKPKLMISGTEDQFVPVKPFVGFCQTFPEPKECLTIDGADHMWWGYEESVAEKVADFFSRTL